LERLRKEEEERRRKAELERKRQEQSPLRWDQLTEDSQLAECLAALHDKIVRAAAQEHDIVLPSKEDATAVNTFDKTKWTHFKDWYLVEESIRDQFLERELVFASTDPAVVSEACAAGVAIVQEGDQEYADQTDPECEIEPVDPAAKRRWLQYRCWYWHGRKPKGDNPAVLDEIDFAEDSSETIGGQIWSCQSEESKQNLENKFEVFQRFRIEARHDFLGMRLAGVLLSVTHAQCLFDARQERLAIAEGREYVAEDIPEDERPTAAEYDIFGEWVLEEDDEIEEPPPPPEPTSILPWEELGLEEQSLEVCMAVNDPKVSIAALAEGVLVPMPAMTKPMMGDQQEVWAHFEAWYSMEFNETREDFLRIELDVAAVEADVSREWASAKVDVPLEEMVDEDGEPLEEATLFMKKFYFNTKGSRESRIAFLEMKVADIVRQFRESALQLRNKLPTPVMAMSMPPLAVDRPEVAVYRIKVYSWHLDGYTLEEMNEWYEDDQLGLEDYNFVEAEKAEMERKALERKKKEEDAREKKRLEVDKKQLEIEDREANLARLLSKDMDDDGDIMELDGPGQGYVFDSPFDPLFIDGLGYIAGDGTVNGDEQVEEEERKEEDKRRRKEQERLEAEKREQEEKRELEIQRRKEAELAAKQRDSDKEGEIVRIRTYLADLKHTRAIEAEHKAVMEAEAAKAAAAAAIKKEADGEMAKVMAAQAKVQAAQQLVADKKAAEQLIASMRMLEGKMMEEEEALSRMYAKLLEEAERQREAKISFLEDLYTPFKSMFADEDDTPVLASSRNIIQQMQSTSSKRHPKDAYSIPHAQAILEVPECEVYSYSTMSTSFQKSIGIPRSSTKKTTPGQHAGQGSVDESRWTLARSRQGVGMMSSRGRPGSSRGAPGRPGSQSAMTASSSRHSSRSGETHKLADSKRYNQRSVGTAPVISRKQMGRTKRSGSQAVFEQTRPGGAFREKIGVTGAVAPLHPSMMQEAALEAAMGREPEV